MRRLGIFATREEMESIKIHRSCSGMFLAGGTPMGEPKKAIDRIAKNHNLPDIEGHYGIDLGNGELLTSE